MRAVCRAKIQINAFFCRVAPGRRREQPSLPFPVSCALPFFFSLPRPPFSSRSGHSSWRYKCGHLVKRCSSEGGGWRCVCGARGGAGLSRPWPRLGTTSSGTLPAVAKSQSGLFFFPSLPTRDVKSRAEFLQQSNSSQCGATVTYVIVSFSFSESAEEGK